MAYTHWPPLDEDWGETVFESIRVRKLECETPVSVSLNQNLQPDSLIHENWSLGYFCMFLASASWSNIWNVSLVGRTWTEFGEAKRSLFLSRNLKLLGISRNRKKLLMLFSLLKFILPSCVESKRPTALVLQLGWTQSVPSRRFVADTAYSWPKMTGEKCSLTRDDRTLEFCSCIRSGKKNGGWLQANRRFCSDSERQCWQHAGK